MFTQPKMVSLPCDKFEIGGTIVDFMSVRNHAYDKSLNGEESTIEVLIPTKDSTYDYFKAMDKKRYLETKMKYGEIVRQVLISYYKFEDDDGVIAIVKYTQNHGQD